MNIKIFNFTDKKQQDEAQKLLAQSKKPDAKLEKQVAKIIAKTKKNQDKALIKFANKFDGAKFKSAQDLLVSKAEILAAKKNLKPEIKNALKEAYKRIAFYHQKQMPQGFEFKDKTGTMLGNKWQHIESIGVYVPGGSANYPSSVLMSAVPAIVAGVKNIVVCVPSKNGKISDAVLFACKICGIEEIYKIGGAQAIAALTFGTKIIKKVDKIVGPGNAYVAYAKKQLFGEVGIDMIAGPTDITIIADTNNNADWIAADMLSQLEHGADSKAFLITDSKDFAQKVAKSLLDLAKNLSRFEIIKKSITKSAILVIEDLKDSAEIANKIAPEHLEIAIKNPQKIVAEIKNAGAIFIGKYTPEAIGDYIAGPSHTLPTEGTARFSSGLSVFDFLKRISIISCNEKSFIELGKNAAILAGCEGLDAHKLSVEIRKQKTK